jgi:two-component system NarL family sensor kinase
MTSADEERGSLASLLVSVMNAREQEGARISRLLHDDVGQVLSAIGLQLDLLRMDLGEQLASVPARILEIQKYLEQAMGQVRDLSYELNPSIVERTGLQYALDRLIGRYRKSFSGTIRLLFDPSVHVPLKPATALYKIAEQALENSVQHARCSRIEVLVKPVQRSATLEIRDNGIGFPVDAAANETGGLGLHLMRYQAAQGGLQLSFVSAPEKGTIVKAVYRASKLPGSVAPEQ